MKNQFFVLLATVAVVFAESPTQNASNLEEVVCPTDVEGRVFFAYPTDCSKYYVCMSGNRYILECPYNLYWNQAKITCDYLENVDCAVPPAPTAAPTTSHPLCPTLELTYATYPYDCAKYYECYLGSIHLMDCPANLFWNEKTTSCERRELVDCSRTITSTVAPTTPVWTPDPICASYPPGISVFVGHATDCTKYYECFSGHKYTRTCASGLYWNINIRSCDFREHVICPTDPTPKPPGPTAEPSDICEGKPLGAFVPDPLNCAGYYECVNGPVHFMCQDDTYWHQSLSVCDYKENVDCHI